MKAPAHTVIYTHGGGRLGNQVVRFLHWMAWARAHADQVEVLNLAFWPYAELFAHWREHPGCVFPGRAGRADGLARRRRNLPRWLCEWSENRLRLPRLVQASGHWRPGWQAVALDDAQAETFDLDDPGFLAMVTRCEVTTCSGWKIASWQLFARQQAELRRFFLPAPEFANPAQEFMSRLRDRHEVIIGVGS